ncbi:hypothetical protein Lalb_Chr01g0019441 [Lupinus albus]|uniref:Uncharacterized protein n=1 Tax=Lupinus albus TaxID=3870 RepID=A0A6A4R4Q6_LUPAL|nr:hypothetical protein Lalb_Chr01g0019441 [Lupinus albus]
MGEKSPIYSEEMSEIFHCRCRWLDRPNGSIGSVPDNQRLLSLCWTALLGDMRFVADVCAAHMAWQSCVGGVADSVRSDPCGVLSFSSDQ